MPLPPILVRYIRPTTHSPTRDEYDWRRWLDHYQSSSGIFTLSPFVTCVCVRGCVQPTEKDKDKDGRKGSQGRLLKWLGDLSILAGTPQDAVECYVQAMQELKVGG